MGLKLWRDSAYFAIAETAAEARQMTIAANGLAAAAEAGEIEPVEAWEEWPADKLFTFTDEDGTKTSKLPAEWCASDGPGYFASTDY